MLQTAITHKRINGFQSVRGPATSSEPGEAIQPALISLQSTVRPEIDETITPLLVYQQPHANSGRRQPRRRARPHANSGRRQSSPSHSQLQRAWSHRWPTWLRQPANRGGPRCRHTHLPCQVSRDRSLQFISHSIITLISTITVSPRFLFSPVQSPPISNEFLLESPSIKQGQRGASGKSRPNEPGPAQHPITSRQPSHSRTGRPTRPQPQSISHAAKPTSCPRASHHGHPRTTRRPAGRAAQRDTG